MSNDYMFSYYPTKSFVHKQNSTTKIINFILLILIAFIPDIRIVSIAGTIMIVIAVFSNVPLKNYVKINWTFRYFYAIIIIVFAIFNLPLTICLEIILKVIIILTYLMVLTYTTSPIEIANGIEKIIKPFNVFYFKIGKLALKISLFLKFIPICLNVTQNITNSQSSRGFDYRYRTVFGKIFVIFKSIPQIFRLSIQKKNIVKFNMEAKLYNCNKIRTNLNSNNIHVFDIITILILLSLIIIYIFGLI